jgi:hypothetical protein
MIDSHAEPSEPTSEQCNNHDQVFESHDHVGYAIWYPSMGGYSGKAVAVMCKKWVDEGTSRTGGCIDVYVWHDGEFPFHDGEQPTIIHHCCPEGFITFGEKLSRLNNKGRVKT